MTNSGDKRYSDFYEQRRPAQVYPVEFVMRAFLGSYPRLPKPLDGFRGQSVLDLGCGDGRNMPMLSNLGLRVHGVEISEDICASTGARMQALGVAADIRVGRNCRIPYDASAFDQLVACHACYYVDPGTVFADNLNEIARVLRPGGRFVLSAPIGTSYIMRGAEDLGDGHMEIRNDPYGVRNGMILKKFDTEVDLRTALHEHFADARIGSCRNDFWGIDEHVWTAVCWRR